MQKQLSEILKKFTGPKGVLTIGYVVSLLYKLIDFLGNMDWVRANVLESGLIRNAWAIVEPFSALIVSIFGLFLIAVFPTKWPWENGSQNLSREEATLKFLVSIKIDTTSLRDIFTLLAPRMATGLTPGAMPTLLNAHFNISRPDASGEVINNLTLVGLITEKQIGQGYVRYELTDYGREVALLVKVSNQ